jgi:DNA-binding transcriptional LysR family regulator
MHSMDWDDVRVFLAAYRAGSANGAARLLGVRHTTVGRRLAVLEHALDTRLFTRTPEGMSPTAAAIAILPLAEAAERSFLAIQRHAGSGDSVVDGRVRVTTSEAFSDYLVRHLPRLQERHPALTVEIFGGNRVFDLARGEADIAVRMTATTQPDLICRRVGNAGWSLYASEAYVARRGIPNPATDLTGHDVIGFDESLAGSPGAQWLDSYGKTAHIPLRGNSIGAVMSAAVVGIGIAMLPCFLAAGEPALRRLSPQLVSTRGIWVVFHPDVAQTARIRAVIDFVADIIAADADLFAGTEPASPAAPRLSGW